MLLFIFLTSLFLALFWKNCFDIILNLQERSCYLSPGLPKCYSTTPSHIYQNKDVNIVMVLLTKLEASPVFQ